MESLQQKESPSKPRYFVRRALIALAIGVGITLTGAVGAYAAGIGAGSGDDSGGGTPNPNPPGGGSGGGGGTPVISWSYLNSFTKPEFVFGLCPATNSNGDPLRGRMVRWRYIAGTPLSTVHAAIQAGESSELAREYRVTQITKRCLYPAPPTRSTIKVIVGSDAQIRMTVPQSKTLQTASMSTRWGNGERTPEAARASTSSSANVNLNLSELGRYEATARTRAVNVVIASYGGQTDVSGKRIPDRIVSVSSPYTSHSTSSKGELTCEGWNNSWTGGQKSWSWVDCGPTETSTPIYQCVPDSGPAVTVNGEPGSAILFRSGDPVPVKFGAVRPSGLTDVGAERTRWTRTENSTPWRENGVSVRDANFKLSLQPKGSQLFTNDTSTPWRGGLHTNLYIHGYWSSFSGLPTVVTPSYSYQGTARIESVRVTGIDSNGQWETATTYRDVRAMAVCSGEPLVVEYVRSVQGAG